MPTGRKSVRKQTRKKSTSSGTSRAKKTVAAVKKAVKGVKTTRYYDSKTGKRSGSTTAINAPGPNRRRKQRHLKQDAAFLQKTVNKLTKKKKK